MNKTDTLFHATSITASTPPSRRLSMAIDSQPKRAFPPTPVHGLHTDLASQHEATAPEAVLSVEPEFAPFGHWGINE